MTIQPASRSQAAGVDSLRVRTADPSGSAAGVSGGGRFIRQPVSLHSNTSAETLDHLSRDEYASNRKRTALHPKKTKPPKCAPLQRKPSLCCRSGWVPPTYSQPSPSTRLAARIKKQRRADSAMRAWKTEAAESAAVEGSHQRPLPAAADLSVVAAEQPHQQNRPAGRVRGGGFTDPPVEIGGSLNAEQRHMRGARPLLGPASWRAPTTTLTRLGPDALPASAYPSQTTPGRASTPRGVGPAPRPAPATGPQELEAAS